MSNPLRSFLNRAYPTMKHHNPHTPIMIREALNTQPRVFARYEFGREKVEDLSGELSGSKEESDARGWRRDIGRAKRKPRHEPEANSLIPGLDDKAIESKIGALVREGAQ